MYRNNPAVQFCLRAVREGWLGRVFEVHAVMSKQQPLAYRRWLSQFRGGTMYTFGCHLIDLVVSMLGKPDRITPYQRQTHPDENLYDNGLPGYRQVALPPMPGRYDDQLIELAQVIRGEIANPYPLAHERMVQEALLAASIPAGIVFVS
jgi:hypothetical protein